MSEKWNQQGRTAASAVRRGAEATAHHVNESTSTGAKGLRGRVAADLYVNRFFAAKKFARCEAKSLNENLLGPGSAAGKLDTRAHK